jgi:acetolactate decarboxylase
MAFRFLILVLLLALPALPTLGCNRAKPTPITESSAGPVKMLEVQHYGPMRQVMRMGETEPRILLSDAVRTPHAFAVGALEGLAGEIIIIDGDDWTARPDQKVGQILQGPQAVKDEAATLLTLTHVEQWQTTQLESSCNVPQLEEQIAKYAASQRIDTEQPFPFMIKGTASQLDLHLVNGYCPVAIDPATRDTKPWRSSTRQTEVTLVGFYAIDSAGVMTHHTSCLHIHALAELEGEKFLGHVDAVTLNAGAELLVPKIP